MAMLIKAIIILLFVFAIAGIGFDSVDLLPDTVRAQISNIEALRWLAAGFTSIIGLALGLVVLLFALGFKRGITDFALELLQKINRKGGKT
jgi:uncharacterized protein YacL